MGIASLSIAIFSTIFTFILFLIAGLWEASTSGGIDENSPAAVALGLFIFAFIGLDIVSVALGVAGMFQKSRKRICAIIGASLSTAVLIVTASVLALGMAIG